MGTQNQQVKFNKPSARVTTRRKYYAMPLTASSSVAFQPEWKREIVVHESGNPPKLHVNNASAIWSGTSNVMDPTPQEHVDSANAHNRYTCEACLKSFPSALHLSIHSATHEKQTQCERSRESGQTFSTEVYSKGHMQSRDLSSNRSSMTLKHQCPKCLKTFCSPSKLQRHFLIHTGQKPYPCVICWKTFRQKVHLKSHLSTANTCSLSVGTERKFCYSRQTSGRHRTPVNSSVELELQCKIRVNAAQDVNVTEINPDAVVKAEQSISTRQSYEREQHYSTQKSPKPFQCMTCSRSFRLRVNLARHCEIHRKQKKVGSPTHVQNGNNVKMSDSEEMTHLPEVLNIVVKPETWSGNRSDYDDSLPGDSELNTSAQQRRGTYQRRINVIHQCHTCFKCFPSVSKLQRHTMTHTGQRPFGCQMCGKRFRQKTHLRVHCRTHLWSRYQKQRSLYISRPPSCMGWFNGRTAADVPVQEMALRKDNDVVWRHLDQTPSVVITQKDNGESGKSLPRITTKKEVVRMTWIAASMQNPRHVQHKCSRCFKCFPSASKLQRHEMVHTGLKPFRCVLCGKAFRQTPHLKAHERTHCEREPSEPVSREGNVGKLTNSQQQPRTSAGVPQWERSARTGGTLSNISVKKENSLFKTNSKSNGTRNQRKVHACQICFKNFAFPHTLSRHSVTHSEMRPHKCSVCGKTFAQHVHLKVHEHGCRQGNGVSRCIRREIINTANIQEKRSEHCTDFNVDVSREQPESHYTSVAHHLFADGDLSYCSEATPTAWLPGPEVGLREENNESETCSYSFPSDLAFEIHKLVQNQNTTAQPFYEDSAFQTKGAPAISDSNKLLGDELFSSAVENELQRDHYWCEPLDVFDCDKCSATFKRENDLERHVCSTDVLPRMSEFSRKNGCDMCFKHFVSPSKLRRHYLTHTGQRPFRCDVCGKTFTQSAHVRTHRLTH